MSTITSDATERVKASIVSARRELQAARNLLPSCGKQAMSAYDQEIQGIIGRLIDLEGTILP